MNNAIQTINQEQALATQFTKEQMQLITSTVAKGASPQELQLFLYRCKLMGLNPLKPGQIHFVKYGNNPGTIVVGIEGFRSIAARTGKLAGIKRGPLKNEEGKLIGAWAEVYRNDWKEPAREEAPLAEYDTGKAMWAKMPETMIKKVAEAAALRMAFPDDLGGIYEQSEMQQAETQKTVFPDQPGEDEGDPSAVQEYTPGFGQWSKYTLKEIAAMNSVESIEAYFGKLERYILDNKYPENHAKFQDFIGRMSNFLADLENGR